MDQAMNVSFVREGRGRFCEVGRTPNDGLRPWSAITHGVGIVAALFGTYFLIARAAAMEAWRGVWVFAVYGTTLIALYAASTVYHSVRGTDETRRILRKIDHGAIYLLIAGTYTPVFAILMHNNFSTGLLSFIWTLAVGGAVMAFAWPTMPRWLSAAIYIILGWISVAVLPFVYRPAWFDVFAWLVIGGIFYTVGGVLYAIKWPGRNNPHFGCHEIFHVFIVLGSVGHFVVMLQLLGV